MSYVGMNAHHYYIFAVMCRNLSLGDVLNIETLIVFQIDERCFLLKTVYALLICPMCATCPVHLILFAFITIIIFGEAPHYAVYENACDVYNTPHNETLWCTLIQRFLSFIP
jgi:hypothetical protein